MNDSPTDDTSPDITSPDVQKADTKLRRIFLAGLTLFGLVMSYFVLQLDGYFSRLQDIARNDLSAAAQQLQDLSSWVFTSLGVVTVLFAIYLIFLAIRIIKHQQYPPPGMRVINDTKILRGRAAQVYGGVALALALAILGAGVVIPWKAQEKLERVLAISLQPTPQTPEQLGL